MDDQQKRIRVQLDLDQHGFDELEGLKADLRAGSRADTVRLGLGLLRWAANQLRGGARILVEKDGHLSGVVFPFLPEPQVKAASAPVTLKRKDLLDEAQVDEARQYLSPEDLMEREREHIREIMRRTRGATGRVAPTTKPASAKEASSHYEEEQG